MAGIIAGLYFTIKILQMVIPLIIKAIGFTIRLMFTAISSFWVGVPKATAQIANGWIRKANNIGFPTIWNGRLYFVIRTLAFLTIVAGWILLAHITVWILNLIF